MLKSLAAGSNKQLHPKTIFSYDFEKLEAEKTMERGAGLALGSQSLRLGKLTTPTDNLTFSVNNFGGEDHQVFTFSIETASDVAEGTMEDSGVYNIHVGKIGIETDKSILVKEVQLVKGRYCARIDVYFI